MSLFKTEVGAVASYRGGWVTAYAAPSGGAVTVERLSAQGDEMWSTTITVDWPDDGYAPAVSVTGSGNNVWIGYDSNDLNYTHHLYQVSSTGTFRGHYDVGTREVTDLAPLAGGGVAAVGRTYSGGSTIPTAFAMSGAGSLKWTADGTEIGTGQFQRIAVGTDVTGTTRAFLSGYQRIVALDAVDGSRDWSTSTPTNAGSGVEFAANKLWYITHPNSTTVRLNALSPITGGTISSITATTPIGAAAASTDLAYDAASGTIAVAAYNPNVPFNSRTTEIVAFSLTARAHVGTTTAPYHTSQLAAGKRHLAFQHIGTVAVRPIADYVRTVTVEAIEVNQVVQTWNNDIEIIGDKAATVRVHLSAAAAQAGDPVYGRLYVSGPGYSGYLHPVDSGEAHPTVDATSPLARADNNTTLDFKIHDYMLADPGNYTFRVHLAADTVCAEARGADVVNDCATTVPVREAIYPDTAFVMASTNATSAGRITPTIDDIRETAARMIDATPASGFQEPLSQATSVYIPDGVRLGDSLWVSVFRAMAPGYSDAEHRLALASAGAAATTEGAAGDVNIWLEMPLPLRPLDRDSYRQLGDTRDDVDPESTPGYPTQPPFSFRNGAAHEFVHSYGFGHTGIPGDYIGDYGLIQFWCSPRDAATYPADAIAGVYLPGFEETGAGRVFGDGQDLKLVPPIGPIGDATTEVWGVVPRLISNADFAVVDPYANTTLMSYCQAFRVDQTAMGVWPAGSTYTRLLAAMRDEAAGGAPPANSLATSSSALLTADGPGLVVSIGPDAAGNLQTLFAPMATTGTEVLDQADFGAEVTVVGLDAEGVELFSLTGLAPTTAGTDDVAATFVMPTTGVSTIRVLDDTGEVVDELERSAAAPTLELAGLAAGDALDPTNLILATTAADGDSAELWITTEVSRDGGASWALLAVPVPYREALDLSGIDMAGGSGLQLRVGVSDLFNTTYVTVNDLSAPDSASRLVLNTDDGAAAHSGPTVELRADAYDLEDGDLSSTIVWNSDAAGPLGTGAAVTVPMSALGNGEHTITATVTDAAGNVTQRSLQLTVEAVAPLPEPAPDTGAATVGDASVIDVFANDALVDAPGVEYLDRSGLPWANLTDAGYLIEASEAGTFTLTYALCLDGMCQEAEVTLTIEPPGSAPDAADDEAAVDVGAAVEIDVLANDSDNEGDLILDSLTVEQPPSRGVAEATSSGTITYTAGTVPGTDSFSYQVCDQTNRCDEALVTIVITDPTPELECTIVGTAGDDVLHGTDGDDVICGLGGDDTLFGLEGNDVLLGGDGNDRLHGSVGNDVLDGGAGNDQLHGDKGDDRLYGGSGDDRLWGGLDDDQLHGGPGDDALNGGPNKDIDALVDNGDESCLTAGNCWP